MTARTFLDGRVRLHCGDCLDVLAALPENSVDSVVTDPPYHLMSITKRFAKDGGASRTLPVKEHAYKRLSRGFMGKVWDGGDVAFRPETWAAVLRVLKPGGYLLAFASTRGFGEMSVAIKEAGFVTHPMLAYLCESPDVADFVASLDPAQRDAFLKLLDHSDVGGILGWLFGSGFPKATRIKAEGYDGQRYGGQALKPAIEPIFMGQKPFSEDSGTANILRWGTGAVSIDECRVGFASKEDQAAAAAAAAAQRSCRDQNEGRNAYGRFENGEASLAPYLQNMGKGRWPANVVHDGSAGVVAGFPETGEARDARPREIVKGSSGANAEGNRSAAYGAESRASGSVTGIDRRDGGSAARFFYSAKADAEDRLGSKHPTVKPVGLMQWLVRLVTPKNGICLDPFAGTGTTGEACFREGRRAILIEREPEYQEDIARRMELAIAGPDARRAAITPQRPIDDLGLFASIFDGEAAE